jgi:hypothetical protein
MGFHLVPFLFFGRKATTRKLRFTKNRKNKNFHFWKVVGPKSYFWLSRLSALGAIFYGLSSDATLILRSQRVSAKNAN